MKISKNTNCSSVVLLNKVIFSEQKSFQPDYTVAAFLTLAGTGKPFQARVLQRFTKS